MLPSSLRVAIPSTPTSPYRLGHHEVEPVPHSHSYEIINSTNLNRYRATVVIIEPDACNDSKYTFVSQSYLKTNERVIREEVDDIPTSDVTDASYPFSDEHAPVGDSLIGLEEALSLADKTWPVLMTYDTEMTKQPCQPVELDHPSWPIMTSCFRRLTRGKSQARTRSRQCSPTQPFPPHIPPPEEIVTLEARSPSPRSRKQALQGSSAPLSRSLNSL